jgi:hypothetical protein
LKRLFCFASSDDTLLKQGVNEQRFSACPLDIVVQFLIEAASLTRIGGCSVFD